jgi:divalent metal cation (Fe/Co/Zn/Cd) transporter
VISAFIASRVRSLLLGRSADPEIRDAIESIISEHEGIVQVYNIITIQFGPDTMLAAKIRMRDGMDIGAAVASINALERQLKSRIDKLKWCFIEPDVSD